ncbi:MAG: hypothetical protein WCE79_25380 [Xanthobacteraceae bacterium]
MTTTVTSIRESLTDGTANVGDKITFTLAMSAAVDGCGDADAGAEQWRDGNL